MPLDDFITPGEWKHLVSWVTLRPSDPELRHQALRLLQEARARLMLPGVWQQGHDRSYQPDVPGGWSFCARGVVLYLGSCLGFGASVREAILALAQAAPVEIDETGMGPHSIIAAYNDDCRTTLDRVDAWFGRATDRLERELHPVEPGRA